MFNTCTGILPPWPDIFPQEMGFELATFDMEIEENR
jgi:hypothetical protein